MGKIALVGSSVAVLTVMELILAGSVVFLFLVPGGIAIGLAVVGIALKSDANGGDYRKQFMIH